MADPTPVVALTIAGSDSSGGAGLQADLKTFAALGVYGASVVSALTAQNTLGVTGVHTVPASFVTKQLDAVFSDLDVKAVKTGMLANAGIIAAVADALRARPGIPLVVDPVMVATSGDRLLQPDAVEVYRRALFPLATLITPNLPEAAALLGTAVATDLAGAEAQARALLAFGAGAVLVKGGHRAGPEAIDVLAMSHEVVHVKAPWIDTSNTHGTGCTLSAAIAAFLASGRSLVEAVEAAKRYLTGALAAAKSHTLGGGHGPVDHAFASRQHPRLW